MKIPFSPPDITESEIEEVIKTLKSGWLTTGPRVKEFEKNIAKYCNTKKAVCLNSATACMELTLRLLGIKNGDEVITSAYTYTATASVVCHVGAKLVLVDTKKDSYEMDYEQLAEKITEKTKVIIPVDLAGVMCDYETIYGIVEEKQHLFQPKNEIQSLFGRIIVMTDAAHAFGAYQINRNNKKIMCGEAADFTCFSFHAVKNLTTAEGGAVTWNEKEGMDSEKLYQQYMLMSLHGQSKDALAKTKLGAWEYDIVAPYYKCNMTDIMAAIGLKQLERYDKLLQKRKHIIDIYNQNIETWNQSEQYKIQVLEHETEKKVSSKHLYLIRILGIDVQERNVIIEKMAAREIAVNVHYKPLPMLTAYKEIGFRIADFPNAYELYKNEITLPLHTCMTEEEAIYVIKNLLEIVKENEMENMGRTSKQYAV